MRRALSYLWPKSLYAQLLLAAALALLFAQIINAVLLYNGLRNRAELEAATLVVGAVMARSGDEVRNREQGIKPKKRRRRRGVFYSVSTSRLGGEKFPIDAGLSERAAGFLGLPTSEANGPAIAIGPTAALPERLRRKALERPMVRRMLRDGLPPPERALILSMRQDDGNWNNAIILVRPIERGSVAALIFQTLLLYLIVLLALALVARRISRPLARLKGGMSAFGESGEAVAIEEEGPSDIRELVSAYNGMQQRLGALLSEKDVMLGAIGHDLKTPLASLRVRVESVDDEDERNQMVASIDEMTAILDDILTLARMGKSGEAVQQTDIGSLIETVLDDFAAQEDNLTFQAPTTNVSAAIRPMLLRRALRNLVGNALRYGGNADVYVESMGNSVEVVITDNGPGIAEADMDAMFEPFTRAEASRNKASGGTGLGLTIARAIARAHGGDVTLSNRSEGGLEARLTLAR